MLHKDQYLCVAAVVYNHTNPLVLKPILGFGFKVNMGRFYLIFSAAIFLTSCNQLTSGATSTPIPSMTSTIAANTTVVPVATITPTATLRPLVPDFAHIVIIVFENNEFGSVIGNSAMPNYNRLAGEYTLLTQYYAVTHPSLPNYIALIGGDTFGIDRNCYDCFINGPNLPDQIEASGRSWKTYQEGMPQTCFVGSTDTYTQRNNPFIYFDPIRLNKPRCERSIVPLTELDADLAAVSLPNYIFITPNLCNNAHDCGLDVADAWVGEMVTKLTAALASKASTEPYLIVLTWEEGETDDTCCGLGGWAGGRVATVLISPLVKNGFQDSTPYTHYSLLKTIEEAWGLLYMGHAADVTNVIMVAPWR